MEQSEEVKENILVTKNPLNQKFFLSKKIGMRSWQSIREAKLNEKLAKNLKLNKTRKKKNTPNEQKEKQNIKNNVDKTTKTTK